MIGMGSRELDNALDRWLTTPSDEEETNFKCERCGLELYPGDKFYDCEGYKLCHECAIEWIDEQAQIVSYEQAFGE